MSVLFSGSRRGLARVAAASAAGILILASAVVFAAPAQAFGSFTGSNGLDYSFNTGVGEEGTVSVVGYNGPSTVVVPATVVVESTSYDVTNIRHDAFGYRGLTSLTLSEGLQTIGEFAFDNNSLTELNIPSTVTTIGSYAFYDNDLGRLALPAGLTSIGSDAFAYNSLESLAIPAPVTSIGSRAFLANALTSVVFAGAAPTTFTAGTDVDASLGDPAGATVRYLPEFGV